MITVNTKTDHVPSTQSMCRLLEISNDVNGLFVDLDRLLEYHFYYRNEFGRIAQYLYRYINPTSNIKKMAGKSDMLDWINKCNIGYLFDKTEKNSISLAQESVDSVLTSGALNEEQMQVLKMYSYASSCASKVGQFGSILSMKLPIEKELSCELHRMIRLSPVWVAQNTHRFATQGPAFQNFTKDTQDIITVPRGYVKCDADSGQIEPRITYSTIIPDPVIQYCIKEYNDAYFGLLYYTQMPEELFVKKNTNFKVPEVTEQMKLQRTELKTAGNAILYGSGDTHNGSQVYINYIKRIGQHPLRLKYVQECTEKIINNDYIFYTAFGEPVDVRESANSKDKYGAASDKAKMSHYIRSAINVLMQGTAAGLMKVAMKHENDYIMKHELKSFMMLSVHDAIKTAIHEDEMDKHGEIIANMPSYQVNDWIPIYAEAEMGPHRVNKDLVGNKIFY